MVSNFLKGMPCLPNLFKQIHPWSTLRRRWALFASTGLYNAIGTLGVKPLWGEGEVDIGVLGHLFGHMVEHLSR